jgi:hypothetical protein
MASQGTWVTPEGILRKFPRFWVRNNRVESGKINVGSTIQQLELEIDMTTLPNGTPNYNIDYSNAGTLNGYSPNDAFIPANATVTSAQIFVKEAALGGTSFDIGVFQNDGTAVDADGLDVGVLLAAVDTVGKRVDCDGVLTVAATSAIGANDAVIGVTATGAFTAGVIRVVVEYVLN